MHAGFGPQPAVGVIALDLHGRAFHAGDFAGIRIDHFRGEAARGSPAQVHAQQHLRPVLRLSAAGTRLDVEEGVVRVHLAMKHAFQLERTDIGLEALRVSVNVARSGFVVLALGELEKLSSVGYSFGGALDLDRVGGQSRALASEFLRTLGFRPDSRVFQLARYLFEALFL